MLTRGYRSPIPGFSSRGRKRGTRTRAPASGRWPRGMRSPKAGQAAMAVAAGRGGRWAVTGRAMGRRLADRGPRAAAGGGHKKECSGACSGPASAALPDSPSLDPHPGLLPGRRSHLGAWAWAQRGGGSRWRCGGDDGAGAGAVGPMAGVMAGY